MMMSLSACPGQAASIGLTIRPPKHPKNKVAFAPHKRDDAVLLTPLAGARSQNIQQPGVMLVALLILAVADPNFQVERVFRFY